jgi:hypothetical protein
MRLAICPALIYKKVIRLTSFFDLNLDPACMYVPFIIELRILTKPTRHPQSMKSDMNRRISPTPQSSMLVSSKRNSPSERNKDFVLIAVNLQILKGKLTTWNRFGNVSALLDQGSVFVIWIINCPSLENTGIELK